MAESNLSAIRFIWGGTYTCIDHLSVEPVAVHFRIFIAADTMRNRQAQHHVAKDAVQQRQLHFSPLASTIKVLSPLPQHRSVSTSPRQSATVNRPHKPSCLLLGKCRRRTDTKIIALMVYLSLNCPNILLQIICGASTGQALLAPFSVSPRSQIATVGTFSFASVFIQHPHKIKRP